MLVYHLVSNILDGGQKLSVVIYCRRSKCQTGLCVDQQWATADSNFHH